MKKKVELGPVELVRDVFTESLSYQCWCNELSRMICIGFPVSIS